MFDMDMSLAGILLAVASTGLLSGLSPCTLPTAVFITAFVNGKRDYSPVTGFMLTSAFIAGIVVFLALLGLFSGLLGGLLLNTTGLDYIVAAILIVMGLSLLKVIQFDISGKLPQFKVSRGSGMAGAFLMGLPFGLSASPCTLPVTASVLAFAATRGTPTYGALLLIVFALARSLPLLIVGTFTGLLGSIQQVGKYQQTIEKVSGVALIIVALFFIWQA